MKTYTGETTHKRELKQKQIRNDTSEGVVRLYSHDIAWWLNGAGHELSETDEEHICRMLEQNCYAGELCSTTADGREVYGWWNIKKRLFDTLPQKYLDNMVRYIGKKHHED